MWEKILQNTTTVLQHEAVCSDYKVQMKKFDSASLILKGSYVPVLRTGLSETGTLGYTCTGICSGFQKLSQGVHFCSSFILV